MREPETGPNKNPALAAGFSDQLEAKDYRARRSELPRRGAFFDDNAAHEFVIIHKS
jgi:hypothetical protein